MQKERVTTKIWQHSLQQLKILAALKRVTMIDLLEQLIAAEWERVQQQEKPEKQL